MAFDNDKLNRHRLERAKRKKEEAARKKQRKTLFVAVAVILAVGTIILLFATGILRFPFLPDLSNPSTKPTETTPPPQTDPPPLTEDRVIHLVAGGDLNITDKVIASGATEGGYNYTDVFLDVASILAAGDVSMLNFEGILAGAPYGSSRHSAPAQLVQALDRAGVDILQTANSYSIADGLSSLRSTIQGIRDAGMEPAGTFTDSEEFNRNNGFILWDIQGVRVAVVAFTKGMDGMGLPAGSENCVNLLYTDYSSSYQKVDTAGITAILKDVEAEQPDVTIALLHWGSEFNDQISATQEEIRDLMYEQGVDAIIGSHPHYVQEMAFDETSGTFIAYSLGDFLGDAERSGTNYSVLLDLQITKYAATGETKITGFDYTPIITLDETDSGGQLRVLRIREAMAAYENHFVNSVSPEDYAAMQNALERITARVNGN